MAESIAIFHLARSPFTGVWSVIQALALEQVRRGLPVAIGVLTCPRWSNLYGEALEKLRNAGVKIFSAAVPDWPYTILFPAMIARWRVLGQPWVAWVEEFLDSHDLRECAIHSHNAWLSGAYVPMRFVGAARRVGIVATYHGIQGTPDIICFVANRTDYAVGSAWLGSTSGIFQFLGFCAHRRLVLHLGFVA